MTVSFIHRGGAEMASFRYRAQIPAEELGAKINNTDAEAIIFAKPMQGDVELARSLKLQGKTIVVDFCDNHFDGKLYQDIAKVADLVTCPSEAMRDIIKAQGFDSVVINDPYEYLGDPHANGDRLLWFGHQSNIGEIVPYIAKGMDIECVTGNTDVLEGYTPWSVENLGHALTRANIVLIPDGKKTRSNNRLVNAVAAGCFVVAGEQHKDCRRFVWANKSIMAGLSFAKCFKDELNDMVKEGQQWADKHHSPKAVGEQWKSALESI